MRFWSGCCYYTIIVLYYILYVFAINSHRPVKMYGNSFLPSQVNSVVSIEMNRKFTNTTNSIQCSLSGFMNIPIITLPPVPPTNSGFTGSIPGECLYWHFTMSVPYVLHLIPILFFIGPCVSTTLENGQYWAALHSLVHKFLGEYVLVEFSDSYLSFGFLTYAVNRFLQVCSAAPLADGNTTVWKMSLTFAMHRL